MNVTIPIFNIFDILKKYGSDHLKKLHEFAIKSIQSYCIEEITILFSSYLPLFAVFKRIRNIESKE